MSNSTDLKKQQQERFKELFVIARQRYLQAGGDPRRSNGSLHGNDYLTDEERKELAMLGCKLSGFYVKDGYAHEQGRSWKLPESSRLEIEELESES